MDALDLAERAVLERFSRWRRALANPFAPDSHVLRDEMILPGAALGDELDDLLNRADDACWYVGTAVQYRGQLPPEWFEDRAGLTASATSPVASPRGSSSVLSPEQILELDRLRLAYAPFAQRSATVDVWPYPLLLARFEVLASRVKDRLDGLLEALRNPIEQGIAKFITKSYIIYEF